MTPDAASPHRAPAVPDRARRLFDALSERAAALGAVVWLCDADGQILLSPSLDAEWQSLDVRRLTESVTAAAQSDETIRVMIDGRVIDLHRVADMLGSRVRNLYVSAAMVEPGSRVSVPTVLQWSFKDLARHESDAETIEQFATRLEQSYEETHLLFRVARLLNHTYRPEESIRGMISQLHGITPFKWIGLQFADDERCLDVLRGQFMGAGKLPTEQASMRSQLLAPLEQAKADSWTKIEYPKDGGLAAMTGSEVLREPVVDDGRPIALLVAGNKEGRDPGLSSFETQLFDAVADFLGVFHQNATRFREERAMFMGTLRALTAAIDAKDAYTRGHSERVALLASLMAHAMGLSDVEVEQYRIAGLVHDVGKIGVPEAVLCKPGRLTDEEFALIKRHPSLGDEMLKGIPALAPMRPGVRHHHEKWNGQGYPDGLAGEQIPLIARVLTLADTFDAMSSNRSYRSSLPREKVLAELQRCAGTQFDPQLAALFVKLDFKPFDEMIATHQAQAHPNPALPAA